MTLGRESSEKAMKKSSLVSRPQFPDTLQTAVCQIFPSVTGNTQCPWQILFPRLV